MPTFDFSNPALYNRTYIPLMKNKSEFLDLWGSAGSGKSYFEAQKEIVKSFSPKRKNRNTMVVRKVYGTLQDSCYALLKAVIYDMKLDDCFKMTTSPLRIENKITGVTFLFRGFDDPEKIKSIVDVDRTWYEEATESEGEDEILLIRGRMRGFSEIQITMCYNPIDEHHWINENIHNAKGHKGHYLHHSTYLDNEKMLAKDPSFAAFLEGTALTDPNYHRVYALGLWGHVTEGLIYNDVRVVPQFPQARGEDDIQWYGLDFGFSDPTALVAQHLEDALPKQRLHNKEIIYKAGLDGPALVREFAREGVRQDRVIIADNARPEMIKTLRKAGYNVIPCIKFAGSVLSGINDVRSFEFCIEAGSKELIKESRNYSKNKVKGKWVEEPAPGQVDHGMDAVRYGAQKAKAPVRKKKKIRSSGQSAFDG